jgi:hypothetical protein
MATLTLVLANLVGLALPFWYDYSIWELVLAMLLMDVCLYPIFRYIVRKETGLPVLPVLCMSFAVQYAMPVFTQEPRVILAQNEVRYLDDSDVVAALALSILGVFLLQVSYYLLRRPRIAKKIPAISLHLSEARAEIFCVAVFVIYLLAGRMQSLLPEDTFQQFSAVFTLLQNQLLVAIAVLAWLAFSVRRHKRHLVMLYFVVFVATLRGFATTMMELMIVPLAVLFIARWTYTRKVPLVSLATIALAFLFFSPVKMDIRSSVLGEIEATGRQQAQSRASEWIDSASRFWVESFQGKRPLGESTADASSRADLIHTFAYIYSFTPSVVSYQHGSTYSYLMIAWIPRMLWPEKPVANYANNFYAIEYGVSTEEGVKTSSFGATLMGEGFMNFGAPGVVLIMIVLGSTLSLMERIFGSGRSGVGGQAVLLAVFVYFLNGIGSSAELMFGGIVQNMICSAILIVWARAPSIGRLSKLNPARAHSHG